MNTTRTIILALCSALFIVASQFPSAEAQLDQPNLIETFPAGSVPTYMAFDGENIWVLNQGDDSVTKLRASDGSVQGNFLLILGPQGIVFDGSNIWVSSFSLAKLIKLRASDGSLLGIFRVGQGPQGLTFDGANIWVAN